MASGPQRGIDPAGRVYTKSQSGGYLRTPLPPPQRVILPAQCGGRPALPERSRPQGRPRHVPLATTATPTTATAAGHRMVLPAPLTGHRRRPEGKLRAGSAAEGVRDWPGLVLGHQPLHVTRVGSLSCLADGAYWVLLAWILHLPPSAVPLVSDVRFRRSAQRLARLT
jgi:hypothetical protein